ncbi:hypothetical protein JOM56_008181 [Amanita muscaria]
MAFSSIPLLVTIMAVEKMDFLGVFPLSPFHYRKYLRSRSFIFSSAALSAISMAASLIRNLAVSIDI